MQIVYKINWMRIANTERQFTKKISQSLAAAAVVAVAVSMMAMPVQPVNLK